MKEFGVGIYDADYPARKKPPCLFYVRWHGMLMRCYCDALHKRHPTYIGCEVCEEWKSFMTFRSWMKNQDWEEKQLDKDFLGNGKLYSPETCCFIPAWLNTLFSGPTESEGGLPIGVCRYGDKFQAYIQINGKKRSLGRSFNTVEEASIAYNKAKRGYVIKKMMGFPDGVIKDAVMKKLEEFLEKTDTEEGKAGLLD